MENERLLQRAFFIERLRQGLPIVAAIEQLAEESPDTLVDLSIGEVAIGLPEFMALTLPFIALMEEYVPSKALYLRLLSLYPELESSIFDIARQRHAREDWLIELILKAKAPADIARIHLLTLDIDAQAFWLERYIDQSFMDGVWALAQEGDMRPVFLLLDRERYSEAARATAYILDTAPDCGVLELVCAQYGPNIEGWILRVLAEIQKPLTTVAIEHVLKWYPLAKNMH